MQLRNTQLKDSLEIPQASLVRFDTPNRQFEPGTQTNYLLFRLFFSVSVYLLVEKMFDSKMFENLLRKENQTRTRLLVNILGHLDLLKVFRLSLLPNNIVQVCSVLDVYQSISPLLRDRELFFQPNVASRDMLDSLRYVGF